MGKTNCVQVCLLYLCIFGLKPSKQTDSKTLKTLVPTIKEADICQYGRNIKEHTSVENYICVLRMLTQQKHLLPFFRKKRSSEIASKVSPTNLNSRRQIYNEFLRKILRKNKQRDERRDHASTLAIEEENSEREKRDGEDKDNEEEDQTVSDQSKKQNHNLLLDRYRKIHQQQTSHQLASEMRNAREERLAKLRMFYRNRNKISPSVPENEVQESEENESSNIGNQPYLVQNQIRKKGDKAETEDDSSVESEESHKVDIQSDNSDNEIDYQQNVIRNQEERSKAGGSNDTTLPVSSSQATSLFHGVSQQSEKMPAVSQETMPSLLKTTMAPVRKSSGFLKATNEETITTLPSKPRKRNGKRRKNGKKRQGRKRRGRKGRDRSKRRRNRKRGRGRRRRKFRLRHKMASINPSAGNLTYNSEGLTFSSTSTVPLSSIKNTLIEQTTTSSSITSQALNISSQAVTLADSTERSPELEELDNTTNAFSTSKANDKDDSNVTTSEYANSTAKDQVFDKSLNHSIEQELNMSTEALNNSKTSAQANFPTLQMVLFNETLEFTSSAGPHSPPTKANVSNGELNSTLTLSTQPSSPSQSTTTTLSPPPRNRWISWARNRRKWSKRKARGKKKGESLRNIARGSVAQSLAEETTSEHRLTLATTTTKSPFIGHKTAYDFLSNQGMKVRIVGEEKREADEINKFMGENMCEIFNKHYVPTRIGGKCV